MLAREENIFGAHTSCNKNANMSVIDMAQFGTQRAARWLRGIKSEFFNKVENRFVCLPVPAPLAS
jgi:hypothetical protein